LKPVKDNNNKSSLSSTNSKEAPASTSNHEEAESRQQAEESTTQLPETGTTENVGEYLLRSPRKIRTFPKLRSRLRKSISPYKPVIPPLFLKENYLSFKDNSNSFESILYPLDNGIRDEILFSARANLLPVPKGNNAVPAIRGHLLLNCPMEGASFYLDSIVKSVAASLHADLLIFDRQDLMELTANMFSRKGNGEMILSQNSQYNELN
jgi:hypothetical protein